MDVLFIILLLVAVSSPIVWLLVEVTKVKVWWRLLCGILAIIGVSFLVFIYCGITDIAKQSKNYHYFLRIRAVISDINQKLKTSKPAEDESVREVIKSLDKLSAISSYSNEKDLKMMDEIIANLSLEKADKNK